MKVGPWQLQPDMLTSIAATLISLCALATTYWQTKINREWQQASVWPRLTFTVSNSTDDDTDSATYELHLGNVGIGPALIQKAAVRYRGQELTSSDGRSRMRVFLNQIIDEHKVRSERKVQTSQGELKPGMVVAADKRTVMLMVSGDRRYWDAIRTSLPQLEITVEYSSVYGETWEVTYPAMGHRFVGWTKAEVH